MKAFKFFLGGIVVLLVIGFFNNRSSPPPTNTPTPARSKPEPAAAVEPVELAGRVRVGVDGEHAAGLDGQAQLRFLVRHDGHSPLAYQREVGAVGQILGRRHKPRHGRGKVDAG